MEHTQRYDVWEPQALMADNVCVWHSGPVPQAEWSLSPHHSVTLSLLEPCSIQKRVGESSDRGKAYCPGNLSPHPQLLRLQAQDCINGSQPASSKMILSHPPSNMLGVLGPCTQLEDIRERCGVTCGYFRGSRAHI